MTRFAVLLLILLGGCAASGSDDVDTPPTGDGWGPTSEAGLGIRVVLDTPSPKLGEPIRVHLELRNQGTKPQPYHAQSVDLNNSVRVRGPGGEELPYVDIGRQTVGDEQTVAPGETVPLGRAFDIAHQYLISRPGRHAVQFRGRRTLFGTPGLPVSNELVFELAPGKIGRERQLTADLAAIVPEGWELTEAVWWGAEKGIQPRGRERVPGIRTELEAPFDSGLKSEQHRRITATIYVADAAAAPAPDAEKRAEHLGKTGGREVYLWAPHPLDEAWPGARDHIKEALGVTP